jgi:hypothetical protein
MSETKIEILGVYKPFLTTDIREWAEEEKGPDYCDQLVLIEALAHSANGLVEMYIGQQPPWSDDKNSFLVPYDEALLTADGEAVIAREMDCVEGTGTLRFAFYLESYDPKKPLSGKYGDIDCPAVQAVPARLIMLMPFNIY